MLYLCKPKFKIMFNNPFSKNGLNGKKKLGNEKRYSSKNLQTLCF